MSELMECYECGEKNVRVQVTIQNYGMKGIITVFYYCKPCWKDTALRGRARRTEAGHFEDEDPRIVRD